MKDIVIAGPTKKDLAKWEKNLNKLRSEGKWNKKLNDLQFFLKENERMPMIFSDFDKNLKMVKDFIKTYKRFPSCNEKNEKTLANWIASNKKDSLALSGEQANKLASLPDWSWNLGDKGTEANPFADENDFDMTFDILEAFCNPDSTLSTCGSAEACAAEMSIADFNAVKETLRQECYQQHFEATEKFAEKIQRLNSLVPPTKKEANSLDRSWNPVMQATGRLFRDNSSTLSAGQKAAATRKANFENASAGKKAAITRKRREAARKAVETRRNMK